MLRNALIALSLLANATAGDLPPLSTGAPAPDFTVTARDGTQLKLSSFKDKSHLVVVFGRAHW